MKTCTRGLVIPSELCLASGEHVEKPVHRDYVHSLDHIARFLERRGIVTERQIRGDLPLGFGLASSTMLAFLHTSRSLSLANATQIVHECDREIHGFEPSGVDAAAIFSQGSGFYSTGGWERIQAPPLRCSLAFLPPERLRSLSEVENAMSGVAIVLTQLANAMSRGIERTGALDYGLFLDYSRVLFDASVYSSASREFVAKLLDAGIAAKAIGGLYDKAILVVWADVEAANRHEHLLDGARIPPPV